MARRDPAKGSSLKLLDVVNFPQRDGAMEISYPNRLFWFLKEGVHLDLGEPSTLDMVVQQIFTRGNSGDIKQLLKSIPWNRVVESIRRVGPFLPLEVRWFWEDFIASHQ